MQYQLFSLAALAVAYAYAQEDSTASGSSDAAELLSVVSVLQTALPSSLINEALTNSAGVSSQLASEFAAGETPAWFTALPTAVQTYLIPAFANATGTMSTAGTGALMTTTTPAATATATGGSGMTGNGTSSAFVPSSSSSSSDVSSSRMSTVMTESGKIGASATGTRGSSSSSSEAGAAMPTGVAMGLAGMAAGIMGVMAL
ncbi:uncharacterized protein SEPMUDRAFT_153559 [Sphaerulina musiva SO2202]|uniref:GPI anchored protein n=1 Tax=Sphaerulina musiva (strain SO2202) TaxID=692275 RepID=N1QKH2_SPHMS|nr:uncharacterized protein SEPMUDRAFT_153559 [Sphaerulina musiva SO2202]EMF17670.1 hypothetical protein SEPMUDRAFT_153559 [Sphaerulina musiva SO2202]